MLDHERIMKKIENTINKLFYKLQALSKEEDSFGRQKFKEEIARQYKYGNDWVQEFLLEEGYLDYLSQDDILKGVLAPEDALFMEKVMKHKNYSLIPCFDLRRDLGRISNKLYVSVEEGKIKEIEIEINHRMKELPKGIGNLTSLITLEIEILFSSDNIFGNQFFPKSVKNLTLSCSEGMEISDYFNYFPNLENLKIRGRIQEISQKPTIQLGESFTKLNHLKYLEIRDFKISSLNCIANLRKLEILDLFYNSFKEFPISIIESIKSLKMLGLGGIELSETEKKRLKKKKIKLL